VKEYRVCEAPTHHPDCNGVGSTKDHFTSKAIARARKWSHKKLNDPENIQYLSPSCHQEKDKNNAQIAQQVRFQVNGGTIRFGEAIT